MRFAVIGDTQCTVFKLLAPSFSGGEMKVSPIDGASAYELDNTRFSVIFNKAIEASDYELCNLGGLDCNSLIWRRAIKDETLVSKELEETLERYFRFVDNIITNHKFAFLAVLPPFPEVKEFTINGKLKRITAREIWDLISEFNDRLFLKNVGYFDINSHLLNSNNLLDSKWLAKGGKALRLKEIAPLWGEELAELSI